MPPSTDTTQKKSAAEAPKLPPIIPPGRYGNTAECPCVDLYQLADILYKMMKKDLRLEQERLGPR